MDISNPEIGQFVEAHGVRTNYHDVGTGVPVLLIHGSGPGLGAYANWSTTISALANYHRVIAPDVAGFGFTNPSREFRYDVDQWVLHLVSVLDALGIEKAHVIGNSFGGALALAMAVAHPNRVLRLGLVSSAGVRFHITPELDAIWGYEPSFENMQKVTGMLTMNGVLGREQSQARFEASIQPGRQEAYAAMFPAPRQRWVNAMASPEEKLRALPHETLIVHGVNDRVIPLSNAYKLLEMIPQASLHVFGRCGHWAQFEQSDRFNRLLVDFLNPRS